MIYHKCICSCEFQLKVYTEQREARNFEDNIGFTTPSDIVSTRIKLTGQDIVIANLYSFIMCFLYAVSVYTFLNHYYPNREQQISTFIKDNNELIGGLTITTVAAVAIEILTRFINSAIWSVSIDNGSGVLVAVWLPQGYIFVMGTCLNVYYHIKYLRNTPNEAPGIREHLNPFSRCYDAIVKKFSANINIHIILPLMLTTFGLVYTAFPALVLMVAYPTQMIVLIPTAAAFLFATVIFSAIMIKLYKQSVECPRQERRRETIVFILCRFIPFYFAVIFLKCVAVIFLYLLIIGRGSVTNIGTLLKLALSFLPPVLVSIVSYIAKKAILD